MGQTIIEKADAFAEAAHGAINQVRRYTGEPYIEHPRAVAKLVADAGGSPEMIAAALLHDTVEDTMVTQADIERAFGAEVSMMVAALTDPPSGQGLNRAARKEIAIEKMRHSSGEVQTIKLADLIHNADSILENDPDFSVLFLHEAQNLLGALTQGDDRLWARLRDRIRSGFIQVHSRKRKDEEAGAAG